MRLASPITDPVPASAWLNTALILAAAAVYFLPAFIAGVRGHRLLVPLAAVNVLLGWTGLGWVAALLWSVVEPGPATAPAPGRSAEAARATGARFRRASPPGGRRRSAPG